MTSNGMTPRRRGRPYSPKGPARFSIGVPVATYHQLQRIADAKGLGSRAKALESLVRDVPRPVSIRMPRERRQ